MRIILIAHHELDPNTGAPGATVQLSRAFTAMGHEVASFSWDDAPRRLGARPRELLFPELVAARLRGAEGRRFDIVDALTGDAWVYARLRRRSADGRPLLVTRSQGLEHNFIRELRREAKAGHFKVPWTSRLYHGHVRLWEVAASLRHSDLCLFANRADLEYAVTRLGVARERTDLFANGVPERFLGRPFQPLTARERPRIAQVGSFAARKGAEYGVHALAGVLREHPEVGASLIGTQVAPESVLNTFPSDVRGRVRVVESYPRDRLPDLLRGHHINLFPTLAEGQSLALVEAMACGLTPVTTTSTADVVVRNGIEGLLVPSRDVKALQVALTRLINDRDMLDRLRHAAHAKAQGYGWDSIARETSRLYERALGNASAGDKP